ncbi:MAG: hypothetical protein K2P81_14630 [Bacteriovoracaceae bacterium]|nr:hypothetical protein [Bacteriovoracaceae bacterium]
MKDDFSDFLSSEEKVPTSLYESTLKYIEICHNPKKVIFKFYLTNILGALITMMICPQYGFGPVGGELGVLHYIMDFGPFWCGVFCASVFMAGGNLSSMIFLNAFEEKCIIAHKYRVTFPWVSALFFMGMIGKYYAPGDISHYTVSFHLAWYVTAVLLSVLLLRIGEHRLKANKIK